MVVAKLVTSFSFNNKVSIGLTRSEVTSSLVPGSASKLIAKVSASVFGKKSLFNIHNAGKESERINNHKIQNKNSIALFLFATIYVRIRS